MPNYPIVTVSSEAGSSLAIISREAGLGSWTGKRSHAPSNHAVGNRVWVILPWHQDGARQLVPAAKWLERCGSYLALR